MASRLKRAAVLGLVLAASGFGVFRGLKLLEFPSLKYAEQISDARRLSPEVKRFEALFPSAESHITYSTGEMGPPSWWSEFSSPEIEITATASLDVDPRSMSVKQVGPVRVVISWIKPREMLSSGQTSIISSGGEDLSMGELDEILRSETSEPGRVADLLARKPHN